MARVNSYTIFRQIHLYSLIVLGVYILVYFVTGLTFRHYTLANEVENLPPDTLNINLNQTARPEEDLVFLQDSLNLAGKRNYIDVRQDHSFQTMIMAATHRYRITVSANRDHVVVQKHITDLREKIHFYHVLHIFGGGFKYDLYLIFQDLVSISMFLFAFSGVYMWYNLMRNKWWGIISIVLGIFYLSAVMISLLS